MIVACHYRSCLFTSSTLYTRTISFFLIHKMKLSARFQREMVVLCLWLFFFFFFTRLQRKRGPPCIFRECARRSKRQGLVSIKRPMRFIPLPFNPESRCVRLPVQNKQSPIKTVFIQAYQKWTYKKIHSAVLFELLN